MGGTRRLPLALAVLAGTDQVGFTDMFVDPGGIVRRGLLFLDDGGDAGWGEGWE